MNILAGICEALYWLVRGDLYVTGTLVKDVATGNQLAHCDYVRAHDYQGAKVKAFRRAARRFKGYALEVGTCYKM